MPRRPPPPDSDESDGGAAPSAPAEVQTSFTSTQSNATLLRNKPLSYKGNYVNVSPGLHVSRFQLDWAVACTRLQLWSDGSLKRGDFQMAQWKNVQDATLHGVLRVMNHLEAASGPVAQLDIAHCFHGGELPLTSSEHTVVRNVLCVLGRSAPVVLLSLGAADEGLDRDFEHGRTLITVRPAELRPLIDVHAALHAYHADGKRAFLAQVAGLPLDSLLEMAQSTEDQKLIIAAAAHLTSKSLLTRLQPISRGRVDRAVDAVGAAMAQLHPLMEVVTAEVAEQRTAALARAEAATALLARMRTAQASDRRVRLLEHDVRVAQRAAELRDPASPDYRAFVKRRWREQARALEPLKHLPRGHRVAIHIQYPQFKEVVETIAQDSGGRASKDRQSTEIIMGKSTWTTLVERLNDEEYMQSLGGTIPATESLLKKYKKRSERSAQPKADPAAQLNIAPRKVAKSMLPTAVEQPNGHMMNKSVKEAEQFGMLNADLIDVDNRDDKANWQLDNVYRKKKVIQELCTFKDRSGAWDQAAYDRATKAEAHDMITASGYRLIITNHTQMCSGVHAVRSDAGSGQLRRLSFDGVGQPMQRDAKAWMTVRVLKLNPSTPFEHARNLLWHVENHREWHVARALLPADGVPAVAAAADPHADAAVRAAAATAANPAAPAVDEAARTERVADTMLAMFDVSVGEPISLKILLRAFDSHADIFCFDVVTALRALADDGLVEYDLATALISMVGIV